MKILVLNCGSSSIKYQLFDMTNETVEAAGVVEKVGLKGAFFKHTRPNGEKIKIETEIKNHGIGIQLILDTLISEENGCLKSYDEIQAIGHRVVHGAETFNSSVLITDAVIEKIEQCIALAPLHNPPNLKGIMEMKKILPNVPQCAAFDTAFHQTMEPHAYMYALPYNLYEKYGIRRYGFHGSSHRYVSKKACKFLDVDYDSQKIITCHLGNGASIAAIKNGESIDTTMGMTPVEGLIMGTRVGDIDAGALLYLADKENMNLDEINTLINKKSGMLGITEKSSDMRPIENAYIEGDKRAQLAYSMYVHRIKKYIGAFTAIMNGLDILIFTGGIGENDGLIRKLTCKNMEYLGIEINESLNYNVRATETDLSLENAKVKTLLIPTNEELVIAKDTFEIINSRKEI